jgi:beta-lactamase class A
MSLTDKIYVNKKNLHYTDFKKSSGKYSVEYLLTQMIHESNNVCYEVLLRRVTKESFNKFLASIGSGTSITSYNFMGNVQPKNRAIEWFNIYKYCHSKAKNANFAWDLFINAKYSPIRDGLGVTVAHKSGWYNKTGACGTAADCAIVKTNNGGAYLMVIFTKRNSAGKYSEKYIAKLAVVLDEVWDDYYNQLKYPKEAKF